MPTRHNSIKPVPIDSAKIPQVIEMINKENSTKTRINTKNKTNCKTKTSTKNRTNIF